MQSQQMFNTSLMKNASLQTGFNSSFMTLTSIELPSNYQIRQFLQIKKSLSYLIKLHSEQKAILHNKNTTVQQMRYKIEQQIKKIEFEKSIILEEKKKYHSLKKLSKNTESRLDKKIKSVKKQRKDLIQKIELLSRRNLVGISFYQPQMQRAQQTKLSNSKSKKQYFSFALQKTSNFLNNIPLSSSKRPSAKNQIQKLNSFQLSQKLNEKNEQKQYEQKFQERNSISFGRKNEEKQQTKNPQIVTMHQKKLQILTIEQGAYTKQDSLKIQIPQSNNESSIDILCENSFDKQNGNPRKSSSPITLDMLESQKVQLKPFYMQKNIQSSKKQHNFQIKFTQQYDYYPSEEEKINKSFRKSNVKIEVQDLFIKNTQQLCKSQTRGLQQPKQNESQNDEMMDSIELNLVSKVSKKKQSSLNISSQKQLVPSDHKSWNSFETPIKSESPNEQNSFSSIRLQAISQLSKQKLQDNSNSQETIDFANKLTPFQNDQEAMELLRSSTKEHNPSKLLKKSVGGTSVKKSPTRFSMPSGMTPDIKEEEDEEDY